MVENLVSHLTDRLDFLFAILLVYFSGRKLLEEYIEKVFDNESGVTRYKCILCGKINNRKGHAENHIENIHFPGAFSYDCKYCEMTFSSKNSLYKHVHRMHKQS